MKFLVWSNEHGAWWRGSRFGYTDSIEEAGRFDRNEAEEICRRASLDGQLTLDRQHGVTGKAYKQVPEVMVLSPEDMGEVAG